MPFSGGKSSSSSMSSAPQHQEQRPLPPRTRTDEPSNDYHGAPAAAKHLHDGGNGVSSSPSESTPASGPHLSLMASRRSKSLSSPGDVSMLNSLVASSGGGSSVALLGPGTPLSVLPEEEQDGTVLDARGNVMITGTASSSSQASLLSSSPAAPSTSSPSTPPKKVWERSYKNFLKLRVSSGGNSGGSQCRNASQQQQSVAPIPPPLVPPHRRAQSTSSATSSVSATTSAATALHATLTTSNPSTVTEAKSEGSVRGGKLFANMFHHHSSNNSRKAKSLSADELDGTLRRGTGKGSYSDAYSPGSNHRQPPPVTTTGAGSVAPSSQPPPVTSTAMKATTHSGPATAAAAAATAAASLPASLRSKDGAPRAVTKLLPRSDEDTEEAHYMSLATMTTAVAPSTAFVGTGASPTSSPRVVIVQEDNGPPDGSATTGHQYPVVSPSHPDNPNNQRTSTNRSDSAMKKAFTEFHNSSSTGRDAVSAYLGDEPSHRGVGVGTRSKDGAAASSTPNYGGSGGAGSGSGTGGGRVHFAGPGHSLAWTSSHHHAISSRGASAMGSKLYASMVELPRAVVTDNTDHATAAAAAPPPATLLPPLAPSPGRAITTGMVDALSASAPNMNEGNHDDVNTKLATLALLSQTAPASVASSFPSGSSTSLVKAPSYFHVSPPVDSAHLSASGSRKSVRVLKPIQSVDNWQPNRRYLIAPAALAACPLHVLPTLAPGPSTTAAQVHEQSSRAGEICSPFGTVVLGRCWMASTPRTLTLPSGGRATVPTPPAALTTAWSEGVLVLRQNYLLEYGPEEYHIRATPRGYAHLQYAVCKDQDDDKDEFRHHVIRLEFFGSPCAKSDPRTLHIQLHDASQRRAWKWCLNRAAQLTIQDLYQYRPNDATGSSLLGKGSYSTVYAACRQGEDASDASSSSSPRHTCALKIFDKTLYWKMVVKGRERADTLVRETSVQATMTAKCGRVSSFVKIRGFFETADHVVLELELLGGGTDLFKYVSARGVLKEPRAAEILHDMLVALQAMNRIGLAHRDVKPANVLMLPAGSKSVAAMSSGGGMPSCKIADFGMSTFVGVDGQLRGRCGTPGFVAPEIFTAGVHGGYGNKVDVFSAGVTLYVMLCGYEPFYGESDAELIAANRAAVIDFPDDEWRAVSADAKDLVRQMMHPDPRHRLSPSQALQHRWLDEARRRSGNVDLDRSTTLPTAEAPTDDACTIT